MSAGVPEGGLDKEAIADYLDAAVPLLVLQGTGELRAVGVHDIDVIAFGADVLFRPAGRAARGALPPHLAGDGGKVRDYRPGEVLGAIARTVAIGALLPGGVTSFGRHWCTAPHEGCPAGRTA